MLSRNPELHYVFARTGLAEERGLGIKSLKSRAEELELPLPRFAWEEPYLMLTLFRDPEGAALRLPADLLDALSEEERRGWEFLTSRTVCTRAEYETHMGIDTRKAQRHLKRFSELGLLRKIGASSATAYEVQLP